MSFETGFCPTWRIATFRGPTAWTIWSRWSPAARRVTSSTPPIRLRAGGHQRCGRDPQCLRTAAELHIPVTAPGVSQDIGQSDSGGSSRPPWFPPLRSAAADNDWQLVVRHRRGGPLGAFVADMQQRDLAVSFGALLLLVISMGMLVAASSRAQRLAGFSSTSSQRCPTTPHTAHGHQFRGRQHRTGHRPGSGTIDGIRVGHRAPRAPVVRARRADPPVRGHQPRSAAAHAAKARRVRHRRCHAVEHRGADPRRPVHRGARCRAGSTPVTGDLLAISQLLQNLITNSLKYGRDQRWLRVRATAVDQGGRGRKCRSAFRTGAWGSTRATFPASSIRSIAARRRRLRRFTARGSGSRWPGEWPRPCKGQLTVTSEPGRRKHVHPALARPPINHPGRPVIEFPARTTQPG